MCSLAEGKRYFYSELNGVPGAQARREVNGLV